MWVPIETLFSLLNDSDSDVRQAVVQVLKEQGERVEVESLLPLLNDSSRQVRQAVVECLKNKRKQLSVGLLQPFFYCANEEVWQAVAEILEVLSEKIPLDLLTDLLSYPDDTVRQIALRIVKKQDLWMLSDLTQHAYSILASNKVSGDIFTALSQIHFLSVIVDSDIASTALLKMLTTLLDSPHWLVRRLAVNALGQIRRNIPDAAIQRLLELRRDPDPKMQAVREAADDALAEILSLETGIEDD